MRRHKYTPLQGANYRLLIPTIEPLEAVAEENEY